MVHPCYRWGDGFPRGLRGRRWLYAGLPLQVDRFLAGSQSGRSCQTDSRLVL